MADVCRVARAMCAALVRVIACSSMMPPHKLHLFRIDDLDGLVALEDPTQKLVDAGITSNTNVSFGLCARPPK
jgi:hypothetical protein